MLAVRHYEPHDSEVTIEIFLRAVREIASKDYNQEQVQAWAQVNDPAAWARKRGSRPTWIVTHDGIPAGFSDLEPNGHLDMMFVHPRYQGFGVASLLLSTVEAAARGQGVAIINTEASLTARPFFRSRGFSVIAAQEVEKRGQMLKNFRVPSRLVWKLAERRVSSGLTVG